MENDEELIILYQEGDYSAFESLYARYKSRVYGYIRKKVPADQVDDLFQMVFSKLHEKRHLYRPEYKFSPWFFTLIKNTIIDHYRKDKIEFVELTVEPEAVPALKEELNLNLDHDQERLLYLKFVEEYGYSELEEEFKTSAATLRKRVSRLLKQLKRLRDKDDY